MLLRFERVQNGYDVDENTLGLRVPVASMK